MRKKESLILALDKLSILNDIREIFYESTGLIISFHYPVGGGRWDFYPKDGRSSYCSLVQSSEAGLKKCIESDQEAFESARRERRVTFYTCHAGVVNAVIPLLYQGIEVGSIFTGQVLIEEPNDFGSILLNLAALGLPQDELRRTYRELKIIPEKRFEYNVKLLSLMANYILTKEREIILQKEINRKNRELHRKEEEKAKLEKDLKDLSISILEFEAKKQALSGMEGFPAINALGNTIPKAQLFMKANLHRDIRLIDVARAVYLSPSYFSTLFKEYTGYTFSNYLMKVRIDAAKSLLSDTDLAIKEIVKKVGFEDYNYFNRIFKRMEGIPPAQFRSVFRQASS